MGGKRGISMLRLENINKTYNQGTVNESKLFADFNLTVNQGEFVSVVGSNGSGKTTTLNIICGSISIDSGRVWVNDRDITKLKEYQRAKFIGRVYQNPSMGTCPSMNILENMSLADNKGKPFNLLPGINKKRIDFNRLKTNPFAVIPAGFEPTTDSLEGCCSIQLSYETIV